MTSKLATKILQTGTVRLEAYHNNQIRKAIEALDSKALKDVATVIAYQEELIDNRNANYTRSFRASIFMKLLKLGTTPYTLCYLLLDGFPNCRESCKIQQEGYFNLRMFKDGKIGCINCCKEYILWDNREDGKEITEIFKTCEHKYDPHESIQYVDNTIDGFYYIPCTECGLLCKRYND